MVLSKNYYKKLNVIYGNLAYTKIYVIILFEVMKMKTINITNANQNLFQHVSNLNPVLISEDEWKNIEETLYLSSIPELINNINEIREKENWKDATKYNKNEKW